MPLFYFALLRSIIILPTLYTTKVSPNWDDKEVFIAFNDFCVFIGEVLKIENGTVYPRRTVLIAKGNERLGNDVGIEKTPAVLYRNLSKYMTFFPENSPYHDTTIYIGKRCKILDNEDITPTQLLEFKEAISKANAHFIDNPLFDEMIAEVIPTRQRNAPCEREIAPI